MTFWHGLSKVFCFEGNLKEQTMNFCAMGGTEPMSHTRKRKIMANILKAEECFCFLKPVFPFYIFTKKKKKPFHGW